KGQQRPVRAVDGVSLELNRGETLSVVGESGCGKSTLARAALRIQEPTSGRVIFKGQNLLNLSRKKLRAKRREMQFIFQDPYASLDTRWPVGSIVTEPLVIHGAGDYRSRQKKLHELLELVGLDPTAANRYPHEFSGGQRQRIGIARAVALEPDLIVADEPVSALDVSIQSQIINLLIRLKKDLSLAYIFITHDLAVVKHISDRVAVMYLGVIIEFAGVEELFSNPLHPYTQALISAIPRIDYRQSGRRIVLTGDVPDPSDPPSGCRFHPRCIHRMDVCSQEQPQTLTFRSNGSWHTVNCHLYNDAISR
ncbi:MAG: ATP-binding cassette domain-containing protein, partial [Desulfohalobiaceae bacterium]|nr:ATP-binding cassette domain-containing protein [Desulfohalobiaceae bacterium]